MLSLCHYNPALLRFWFQTNLGRTNSASYLKIQAGKTLSYRGNALVTLYVHFLCSDWSKFDMWVHADNLCSILKLVCFDSWSWQSFVWTCDVFKCLFHWMYKMRYSCYKIVSGVFCYSWLVCLLGFCWEVCRFRRASFSFFRSNKEGPKVSSDSGLAW